MWIGIGKMSVRIFVTGQITGQAEYQYRSLWLKEDLRLKCDFLKTSKFLIKAVIFELDGYTDIHN
jgi:hypothetical protein